MPPYLIIITQIITAGIGAFLGAYLSQKGKNLATKEDIDGITRRTEEIKTELANRSHFSRERYDREMEIYQKVWPKIMDFFQAAYFSEGFDQTDQPNRYAEAFDNVKLVIRENIPFFAKEIQQELLSFQNLCIDHRCYESLMRQRNLTPEEQEHCSGSSDRIKAQLDRVEHAIRNRLSKFD